MLEDRDYMRDSSGKVVWSQTHILMVVFAVIYALQFVNDVYLHTTAEFWLALTPLWFYKGFVWQLLTFQFLHVNLWHLACNLLVFWWAGRYVENVLGKKRFLIALFGCGLIGGLLQGVLMLLFPQHFGPLVMGASAGVSGLFAIFAMIERETEV